MENEERKPDKPGPGGEKGKPPEPPLGAMKEEAAQETARAGSGLTGIMDMSDPLKDVYLTLLKLGDMTMDEIMSEPSFEEKEMLSMYVKILARQGYLERFKEDGKVKFRAVLSDKGKKTVSDDIWDALT